MISRATSGAGMLALRAATIILSASGADLLRTEYDIDLAGGIRLGLPSVSSVPSLSCVPFRPRSELACFSNVVISSPAACYQLPSYPLLRIRVVFHQLTRAILRPGAAWPRESAARKPSSDPAVVLMF